MYKILTFALLSFFLSSLLSAQCTLEVEVADYSCNPDDGTFTFHLLVTGSDSTVRFPEYGLEFPLPLDEFFLLPVDHLDSLVLDLETGAEPDLCQETIVIVRPEDCTFGGGSDCPVSIIPEGLTCGIPSSLTAVSDGLPPFTYQWNTGDTSVTIDFFDAHIDYAVTVTDANGCVGKDSRFFWTSSPFSIHIESSGDPCNGEEPALMASVFHGEGPFTYAWSTGDSTATIMDIVPETTYFVTVTDANGCTSEAQGLYHPGGFNRWLHISGPTSTNCDGTPITLSIEDPDPNFEYTWINGSDTLTGPQITTSLGGYFTVIGTSFDNPTCQTFGSYSVYQTSFDADDLAIVTVAESCDSVICLAVINTETGAFVWGGNTLVWTSPNADNFQQEFGLLCVNETGTYEATITTPCDTTVLFTVIKSFEECIDFCGNILMDMDADCAEDDGNWDMSNTIVLVTNDSTNISYAVHPDADGDFCATAPVGSYTMQTIGGSMDISTTCDFLTTNMEVPPNSTDNMELFARAPGAEETEQTTSIFSRQGTDVHRLTVFPNPSTGFIRINLPEEYIAPTDLLTVYDMTGRKQDQVNGANLGTAWQPKNIVSGVYQLVLTDANGRFKARSSVVFQ